MKTKKFLLATSGATVDGRTIEPKMLTEMAKSYNPKTYGARLNIEHIRGISGDGPFRAYGDVLELSTEEVEVDFNGKPEKRTGLFGVFDVTDDAKRLNETKQKLYPSIEIEPNFAGKGFAYLMGCALTDSPAAIATDRLQFNRHVPGAETLAATEAVLFELADAAGDDDDKAAGLVGKFAAVLESFGSKYFGTGKPPEGAVTTPPADPANPAPAFDFAALRGLFEEFGKTQATAIEGLRTEFRTEVDAIGVKLAAVTKTQEETPSHDYSARPRNDGQAGKYAGIF